MDTAIKGVIKMSCDNVRENASVVDSSLTGCKQDMETLDDPVTSNYKEVRDSFPHGAEEREHSHDRLGKGKGEKEGGLYGTRYFIIKSLNHENIQLSVERGIWATQVINEPVLDKAFHNSGKVILIFSVNMSGFFQGYAQMMSSVGWRRDNVWSHGGGGSNSWGRSFEVKWVCLRDLPFQRTLHLRNSWNEYKPVKISRDCQELPEDIGEALCELLDGKLSIDGEQNGNEPLCHGLPLKRHCSIRDEEYYSSTMNVPWAGIPMHHPSLLYPLEATASALHFSPPTSANGYPFGKFPISSEASRVANGKQSRCNVRLDLDISSRSEVWDSSAEESPLSTLTEDEFLKMSYEEYLKSHIRSRNKESETGKPRSEKEPSTSKGDDHQPSSKSSGDRHSSHKRSRSSRE